MPYKPFVYGLHNQSYSDDSTWTSGSQTVPRSIGEQAFGVGKFGLGLAALGLVGNLEFGSKGRDWDQFAHFARGVEEYSPGRIFRTFQVSHMLSMFESPSQQLRYFSAQTLSQIGSTDPGQAWLDVLSKQTGRTISASALPEGIRFERGRLLVGRKGSEIILRHARVVRAVTGAQPALQVGLARSILEGPLTERLGFSVPKGIPPAAFEARFANEVFSQPIKYIDQAGKAKQEAFSIIGGQSRLKATGRFLGGYGTTLAERINQLARAPFELPVISDILNKVPLVRSLNLGAIPSSGLRTIGKITAKLGGVATLGYLGYKHLDFAARQSETLDETILGEGITAGAATLWTRSQMALSTIAEYTGGHAYREWQEEIAPGSTELSKLLAFPIMGAAAGLSLNYLSRINEQIGLRGKRLSLEQASFAMKAKESILKSKIYGGAIDEDLIKKLGPETFNILEGRVERQLTGFTGRIATSIAKAQKGGGFLSKLAGKIGTTTPGRLNWVGGAIAGAALIAPFLPGALGPSERPEELEALYSGEKKVAIRKGRFWEMGRSAWEGGKIDRYREHWYPRMLARAKDKAIWGEEEISPWKKWWIENMTYELEKSHMKSRPYPISGTAFEDIPFLGPILGATLGRIFKPPAEMHTDQWRRDDEVLAPHLKFGETILPDDLERGEPISPYGPKGVIGRQISNLTEMIGLPGFTMTAIKEAVTGTPDIFDQEMQLESARRMYGAESEFWDMELGGMLGTNELFRRLYLHRNRQIELYNPIRNLMPEEWMPGPGEKSPDFLHGDPFRKIPEGESRLPGIGYSALNPELRGIDPADYPLIHRFKILSDVAMYTDKFKAHTAKVARKIDQGNASKEEIATYREVMEQVRAKKVRRDFSPYKYKERAYSPMEALLAQANEDKKSPDLESSWFERTVGSYWEQLAHGAETPFEFLTPISPAAKLVHMRTAVEDYEQTQVFGTENAFWGHPIRDFVRPFMTSAAQILGVNQIPEHIQKKRDLEEYFDILKYVKHTRLRNAAQISGDAEAVKESESRRRDTLFGLNPFTMNASHVYKALPRRERDYFEAFTGADMEERTKIMEMIPENEKALMVAKWKLKDTEDMKEAMKQGLLSEEQVAKSETLLAQLYEESETEGLPKNQDLWAEYIATRSSGETYPDWYRRTKLLEKRLAGRTLPGPDWVGFCVSENQSIVKSNGLQILAKDIIIGDKLNTHKETRTVKQIYQRKVNEQIHKISITGNTIDHIKITSDHPVLAIQAEKCPFNLRYNSICTNRSTNWKCNFCTDKKHKEYSTQWVKAKNINPNSFLLYPLLKHTDKDLEIDLKNEVDWNKIRCTVSETEIYPKSGIRKPMKRHLVINEAIAWLIGYYLADGNVWKTGKRLRGIQFTAHIKERPILELAKKIILKYFGLKGRIIERYRKTGDSSYLVVASGAFAFLIDNWVGRYCDKKFPPHWLEQITHKAQNALLAGLNTGDATKDHRERLGITNYNLCMMAKRIWESNYIPVSLRKICKRNYKDIFMIEPVDYYTNAIFLHDYVAYRVSSNELIDYNGIVLDFEIEKDHSYLTPIAILHNSPLVSLDDIKMKVVENIGENMYDYDLWPDRARAVARREPIMEEAVEGLEESISPTELRKRITDVLSANNILGAHIGITKLPTSGTTINLELEENRSSSKEQIRKLLN